MVYDSETIRILLLTPEQMSEKYHELRSINFEYPYFYKISNGKQVLYYVGSHHIFNPEDAQLPAIKKHWQDFLDETKKENCVVLVEGGNRTVTGSEQEAILTGGEPHLLALLAFRENIECYSPDRNDGSNLLELNKTFSKEDILYKEFAGVADQWHRLMEPKPDFEQYILKFANRDVSKTGWTEIKPSLQFFKDLHNKKHDHQFSIDDQRCFKDDSNPTVSEIAAANGLIRDVAIAKEILKLWEQGKNIFIIYGSGHAIVHEPALKKLLT